MSAATPVQCTSVKSASEACGDKHIDMSLDAHHSNCDEICCSLLSSGTDEEATQLQIDRTARFLDDLDTNPVERILAGLLPSDRLVLGQWFGGTGPDTRHPQRQRVGRVGLPVRCRNPANRKSLRRTHK
ncbi:hypothetical protein D7B24_008114 [Verticillium nonalfalfae]|uniref:Uncharacterized protein n=1 Tax=Verticillium nonalfalfae TaxID=1051616 RepID=A0A3M9YIN0_9PEZI|nr:uncharacterized protein D7B24_008114 [Verticillium nonalfalfae]RNJ60423.1 hypothetical protein D7B24_008114 [Verticillium nonalfalfae]